MLFVLTCVYCASYDRNTPSADVIASGDSLSIVLNSGRENVYIGGDIEPYTLKRELNRHNAKILKTAVITDENLISAEKIKARVPIENTVNCADFKGVTVDGKIKADLSHYKSYIVLCRNGKSVLIIMPKAQENPFENGQKYDIMIAYGTDCEKYGGYASEIYKMSDGESLDIYWESRNGAYLRSRT